MKLQPVPTSFNSTPVAVAKITAASAPNVNATPASDGTGRKMHQFEALVGNSVSAYSNTALAQRACIQQAANQGYANFSHVASDKNACIILAW